MEHLQRMFIIQFCWISPINSAFPSLNFNQMSLIFIEFWIKFSNLVYFLWIEWIVWNVKHDCILVFLKIWKAKFLFPRSFLFWHDSEHSSLQVTTVSRSKLMKVKVLAFSSFHTKDISILLDLSIWFHHFLPVSILFSYFLHFSQFTNMIWCYFINW